MKLYSSNSLEDTSKIAREWLFDLATGDENKTGDVNGVNGVNDVGAVGVGREEATIVGLSGHLGAGKTAFVKRVAKELGVKEEITSPTFVIMKIYETKSKKWPRLVHIDAYRLEKREELEALNWEQVVGDKNNLVMIEWPENVGLKDFGAGKFLQFKIEEDKFKIKVS